MLLLGWLACSPASSPPVASPESSYLTYDTADGANELQLQLLDEDGSEAVGDAPVSWTMVHGPAGGWHVGVQARLTSTAEDELLMWVDASALVPPDEGFAAEGVGIAAAVDEDGTSRIGVWPDAEVRMFRVGEGITNLAAVCALAGAEAPLRIAVQRVDEELEPVEELVVEHTVRFLLDPMDVPACAEL